MQTKITIRNEAQSCYIDIEGTIGVPEEQQFENAAARVATYEKFRREVARIRDVSAAAVTVNIRSTGGDVNDALLIYDALLSTGARITTRCYGYTASAATVIAQAADEGRREISSNALYLIHNSECAAEGNAEELAGRAELLRKTDRRLAELYARRSGRDEESFAALMAENNGAGRWLSPEETVAAGLADRIFDAVMTGGVVPEPSSGAEETPDTGGGDEPAPPQTGSSEGTDAGGVTARAERPDGDKDVPQAAEEAAKEAAGAVAESIVECVARRFSHCWDGFIERVRERRRARRGERRAERERRRAERRAEREAENGVCDVDGRTAAERPAADSADSAGVSGASGGGEAMPRNVAAWEAAFRDGQRRYGPTCVAAAEDPSMNGPVPRANEKAYCEDARAFSSRP